VHPIRDWNGPNVATFAAQVHNCPVFLALLKVGDGQTRELMPTKPAREQDGQQCCPSSAHRWGPARVLGLARPSTSCQA
jgi:hypothetical protein